MKTTTNADGRPVTAPIATADEAIAEIESVFGRNGYVEGEGDLWLGNTLDRLKAFIAGGAA